MATPNELAVAEALGSLKGRLEGIEGMIKAQSTQSHADASEAKVARAKLYEIVEKQAAIIDDIDRRLEKVEYTVNEMKPVVKEFSLWQTRISTAGWLGKALWITGGFVLATAAWAVATVKGWFGLP